MQAPFFLEHVRYVRFQNRAILSFDNVFLLGALVLLMFGQRLLLENWLRATSRYKRSVGGLSVFFYWCCEVLLIRSMLMNRVSDSWALFAAIACSSSLVLIAFQWAHIRHARRNPWQKRIS
jgi:membrane protease YdiL (CAAX protease family)